MLQGFLNLNTPNYKLKIKKIKTILNSAINNNKLQDFDLNKLKLLQAKYKKTQNTYKQNKNEQNYNKQNKHYITRN